MIKTRMAALLHGLKIRIRVQQRKTYLHANIDNASHYVVRAGFFIPEDNLGYTPVETDEM